MRVTTTQLLELIDAGLVPIEIRDGHTEIAVDALDTPGDGWASLLSSSKVDHLIS